MTTNDKMDIKRCYMLYHVEEDMVVYQKKSKKSSLTTKWCHMRHLNGTDITHAPTTLFIKKST
jgi:NurA-like 5'-3' nuclease